MIPLSVRYRGSAPPPPPPIPTLNVANYVDTTGGGNDLMAGGSSTPSFEADPFGIGQAGLIFDGKITAGGIVSASNWSPPSPAFTIQFRFKRDTAHLGVTQGVLGRWTRRSGVTEFQYLFYFDASNNLNFILSGNNAASPNNTLTVGPITDGAAHSVMVSMNAGLIRIYLDGTRIQEGGSVTPYLAPHTVPILFGTYDDAVGNSAGGSPFYGVLGDFMLSNVARQTAASYTVPTTPAVVDANSMVAISFANIANNYIEAPSFQGKALLRTGYSQASGGWANPDGPFQMIGGGYYFTVSGFNGSQWTVWSVTASTLSALLSGAGSLGGQAIQTPVGPEGNIAGNGSVVPFLGQYWHFYHDQSTVIRYSTGTDLGLPFSPQPGTALFSGYFDPFVLVSPDGTTLTMWMGAGSGSQRSWYVTTSTDGVTWSSPTLIIGDVSQGGFTGAPGEFSITQFAGSAQFGFSDGAPTGTSQRDVIGWGSIDSLNWAPLFLRLSAAGTGSDGGGNPYLSVYDSSPSWDSVNRRMVFLCTLSTNTQPTQPTDSDIGVWFATVANT